MMSTQPEPTTGWRLDLDASDDRAYARLADDRIWNGYSIADLCPPFRPFTQAVVAEDPSGRRGACCVIVRHPLFNFVQPHGDAAAIAHIVAAVAGALPSPAWLNVLPEHVPLFDGVYRTTHREDMVRMAVDARSFRRPDRALAPVERVTSADVPALYDLYAEFDSFPFNEAQVSEGVFYGAREGERLIAAGGTQAISGRYELAAVGALYARAAARGRGLGTAITVARVEECLRLGYRDVFCNVGASNADSLRLHHRLGFRSHCAFVLLSVESAATPPRP